MLSTLGPVVAGTIMVHLERTQEHSCKNDRNLRHL